MPRQNARPAALLLGHVLAVPTQLCRVCLEEAALPYGLCEYCAFMKTVCKRDQYTRRMRRHAIEAVLIALALGILIFGLRYFGMGTVTGGGQ